MKETIVWIAACTPESVTNAFRVLDTLVPALLLISVVTIVGEILLISGHWTGAFTLARSFLACNAITKEMAIHLRSTPQLLQQGSFIIFS